MMRQQSKVVHASSRDDNQRAAKVQERMASSISVDWGVKRAPQNVAVTAPKQPNLLIYAEKGCSAADGEETFQGSHQEQHSCSTTERSQSSQFQGT